MVPRWTAQLQFLPVQASDSRLSLGPGAFARSTAERLVFSNHEWNDFIRKAVRRVP